MRQPAGSDAATALETTAASAPTHPWASVAALNSSSGDPQNAHALQSLSVRGQTGLNVAAGLANADLEPVVFAPGGRMHHRARRRHYRSSACGVTI
jgi:hypothetical protein